jgi:hypothetical protein
MKAIDSKIAIGEEGIVHVQIVKDSDMAFAASRQLRQRVRGRPIPPFLAHCLMNLTQAKVLRGYRQMAPPISRQSV